jgi:hypothetical protein
MRRTFKRNLTLLAVLVPASVIALADTQGPFTPGTVADGGGPDQVWTTPLTATVSLDPAIDQQSNYLMMTNFGFTVPAGATILGISSTIGRAHLGSGNVSDNSVLIVKGGSFAGTDHAVAGNYPRSDTYGSGSDLWGTTWTAGQINASDFGVSIAVISSGGTASTKGEVTDCSITVTYSLPSLPPGGTRRIPYVFEATRTIPER